MDAVRMSVADLLRLCAEALGEVGVPGETADAVARHLVDAEVIGHRSHGLLQLPSLLRDVCAGVLDPVTGPDIEGGGGYLRVDGRNALAYAALPMVVGRAVVEADRHGVCLALIRNLLGSGRLGAYVEVAAGAGMAALLVTGSLHDQQQALVAAFGGRDRVLGTNPIAFAAPTESTPLVVDLSTAAVTMGEIRRCRVLSTHLDTSGIIDGDGRPRRETAAFYGGGAIAPAAGHKGYALGLMVAALGALSADHEADGRLGGSLLLVVRPGSDGYARALGTALDRVGRGGAGQHHDQRVRVPGEDHEPARRRARQAGVLVRVPVLREIARARNEFGGTRERSNGD